MSVSRICVYTYYVFIYIYIQRRKLFAKFNAMHKLGSSPTVSVVRISVLPEVSHMGYRYRVVPYRLRIFCATSERPMRTRLNEYYNNFVGYSYNYE